MVGHDIFVAGGDDESGWRRITKWYLGKEVRLCGHKWREVGKEQRQRKGIEQVAGVTTGGFEQDVSKNSALLKNFAQGLRRWRGMEDVHVDDCNNPNRDRLSNAVLRDDE